MVYSILALFVFVVGIILLFSKELIKSSIFNFLLTVFLFIVLILKQHYLLALSFLAIDILVKLEFFLFLTNKSLFKRKHSFKRKGSLKKIMASFLVAIIFGIFFVVYHNKVIESFVVKPKNLDVLVISTISTLFLLSGYIVKSRLWKK